MITFSGFLIYYKDQLTGPSEEPILVFKLIEFFKLVLIWLKIISSNLSLN